MFEKEAKEKAEEIEAKLTLGVYDNDEDMARDEGWNDGYVNGYEEGFRNGAEFGYNNATEDVKHNLMMKLKDEGIVKPLKDSIFRNERLSSQEQQELCAWIECAMDFGENLDECAKELEEANKANEWHYVKDGLPKELHDVLCFIIHNEHRYVLQGYIRDGRWVLSPLGTYLNNDDVIAWKEIVLPEPSKYWDLSTGENNINKENE